MAQIDRTGVVSFGDATLSVWEEGISTARANGGFKGAAEWERSFKRQVFIRIVQTLNRTGWTCVVPEEMVEQYGLSFARNYRYCVKGNLKAALSVSGRCIKLEMFQNVNAPDRPDHEGRYQFDKERHMPYVLRLEMERTRRKIRAYLCNVFAGYTFKADRADGRQNKCGPGHLTNMEWLAGRYEECWHFKGDLTTYKISDSNRKSADGQELQHGQRVWFFDWKGRVQTGVAYYNINNMWWVLWGKYGHTNEASFKLFTAPPADVRRKQNDKLREKRLKALMDKAVADMKFERAALLRDLLYPEREAA